MSDDWVPSAGDIKALQREASTPREEERLAVTKVAPDGMNASESVEWARTRLEELSPLAAMILENDLRTERGDARFKRALEVLDRAAISKRQEVSTGSAPMVVIQMGSSSQMEWMKRSETPKKEANAKISDGQDSGSKEGN